MTVRTHFASGWQLSRVPCGDLDDGLGRDFIGILHDIAWLSRILMSSWTTFSLSSIVSQSFVD